MRLAIYTKRTNRYTILRHHAPDDLEAAWSRLRQTHIEDPRSKGPSEAFFLSVYKGRSLVLSCLMQVDARLSALEAGGSVRWQHSSKRPLRSDEGEHTGAVKGILRLLSSWSPLRGKRGFRPQRRRKDNPSMSELEQATLWHVCVRCFRADASWADVLCGRRMRCLVRGIFSTRLGRHLQDQLHCHDPKRLLCFAESLQEPSRLQRWLQLQKEHLKEGPLPDKARRREAAREALQRILKDGSHSEEVFLRPQDLLHVLKDSVLCPAFSLELLQLLQKHVFCEGFEGVRRQFFQNQILHVYAELAVSVRESYKILTETEKVLDPHLTESLFTFEAVLNRLPGQLEPAPDEGLPAGKEHGEHAAFGHGQGVLVDFLVDAAQAEQLSASGRHEVFYFHRISAGGGQQDDGTGQGCPATTQACTLPQAQPDGRGWMLGVAEMVKAPPRSDVFLLSARLFFLGQDEVSSADKGSRFQVVPVSDILPVVVNREVEAIWAACRQDGSITPFVDDLLFGTAGSIQATAEVVEVEDAELNQQQIAAVARASAAKLTLVQGPPGTGKSEVAAAIVQQWVKDETESVLLATSTHAAKDVLAKRLRRRQIQPSLRDIFSNPTFPSDISQWSTALHRWEAELREFDRTYKTAFSEDEKVSILAHVAPKELQQSIFMHSDALDNYSKIREYIEQYLINRNLWRRPQGSQFGLTKAANKNVDNQYDDGGVRPMDIGGVKDDKGKGKNDRKEGKGKDNWDNSNKGKDNWSNKGKDKWNGKGNWDNELGQSTPRLLPTKDGASGSNTAVGSVFEGSQRIAKWRDEDVIFSVGDSVVSTVSPGLGCRHLLVDSGACESVAKVGDFKAEIDAPKAKPLFSVQGTPLKVYGKQYPQVMFGQTSGSVEMTVTDAAESLVSVHSLVAKGHKVVFSPGGCYLELETRAGDTVPLELHGKRWYLKVMDKTEGQSQFVGA
eukprot:s1099_g32.t1